VGRTDEALLAEAGEMLLREGGSMKEIICPDALYVSPMLRCRETARILFPGQEQIMVEAFRECDFGEFEYRNYAELNGNLDYQRFIDSGGTCGFPGGETLREFQDRCVSAFCGVVDSEWAENPDSSIAFVVHGGTIMAILDRFSNPHKDYFDWRTGNGTGYAAEVLYDQEAGRLVLEHIAAILQEQAL